MWGIKRLEAYATCFPHNPSSAEAFQPATAQTTAPHPSRPELCALNAMPSILLRL
ncbi:hypothetical protein RB4727 [Rhodopirellula baltica SH 1]|uniref:Uncharacterized protein n=1 Tax=Rhodopirellula baltica (strain DSM 10527 / NCIMB 13988 / SH1) TaxID=243090 RepID=Q7US39_RHOBA|nr:hypothetical protein RB4727 [Rhodopirellula baltica SH 1]